MKLKVGRFGIDMLSGEVQSVSDDGTSVSITGVTAFADAADAAALRQQLLGYVSSPDEAFVPVLWSEQPEVSGFYRVTGASVSGARALAPQGVWDFSVELERVTGFAAPLIELRGLGATRSPAPTTSYPLIVVPDTARSVGFFSEEVGAWIPFNPDGVRSGAFGDVRVYNESGYVTQFYIPPESFYDGAATLMMGDDLNVVVGRQVSSSPRAWRLSNGLYEIEPSGADEFELQHRVWIGGAWSAWVPFMFWSSEGLDSRAPMPAPHSVVVLRNSPTEAAVRLLVTANGEYSPVTFDVSLKRGMLGVGVELRSVFSSRFAIQNSVLSLDQASDYRVNGDAGGVRNSVSSDKELSLVSGGGIIPYEDAVSSVDRWSFFLGATEVAFGTTEPFSSVHQYRAWLWAGSEKQSVVVQ